MRGWVGGYGGLVVLLLATLLIAIVGDRGDPALEGTPTRVASYPTPTSTRVRPTATPRRPLAVPTPASAGAQLPLPTAAGAGTALTPIGAKYAVAHTGGEGLVLRPEPGSGEAVKGWIDGTVVVIVGPDRQANGKTWKNVRDPEGNVGWMAAEYLVPAP